MKAWLTKLSLSYMLRDGAELTQPSTPHEGVELTCGLKPPSPKAENLPASAGRVSTYMVRARLTENFKSALAKLIIFIVLYVSLSAAIQFFFTRILISLASPDIMSYKVYVDVLLALLFGYLIVLSFSNLIYWSLRVRYDHSTSAAVRSLFKIIGIGAMVAVLTGSFSDPTAGVALGGFIGMVVGYASQHVLGQVMAGLFLLLSRPFMIGDKIEVSGVTGIVEDITTLFVIIRTDDNKRVLLPCNSLIGSKIVKHHVKKNN